MNERDLIGRMANGFRRSNDQCNALFECDAEIVKIGGKLWGMSMDDFSPDEDLFSSDDPERLGSNLVTATLGDLFAAGVEPKFFMQSVSLPRVPESGFVERLMNGIRRTLDKTDCALCGGDIGTTETWRFCGFCMGPVMTSRPLTRRLQEEEQTLWVTGTVGDANLSALQRRPAPQFELRADEAAEIRRHATACTDTSGGLLDAVWSFYAQTPSLRFEIDMESIPFANGVRKASKHLGFPLEASLLGGAGEYELLFAVPCDTSVDELSTTGATCIGKVRTGTGRGVYLHRANTPAKAMQQPPPCPRAAPSVEKHIAEVMEMARHLSDNEPIKKT